MFFFVEIEGTLIILSNKLEAKDFQPMPMVDKRHLQKCKDFMGTAQKNVRGGVNVFLKTKKSVVVVLWDGFIDFC